MASPCLMTWWQWHFLPCCNWGRALRGGSVVKNLPANAGDMGSIPGSGRSPGEEKGGNPLQYSCLGSPVDRGAWRAIVHGVSESQTRLRDWTTTTEEKSAGETSPIVPKLQLVRWTSWNLSNLTQDGHKNKTLFYLVLDHRGSLWSCLPILRDAIQALVFVSQGIGPGRSF